LSIVAHNKEKINTQKHFFIKLFKKMKNKEKVSIFKKK